jgi:hypothetical protein
VNFLVMFPTKTRDWTYERKERFINDGLNCGMHMLLLKLIYVGGMI